MDGLDSLRILGRKSAPLRPSQSSSREGKRGVDADFWTVTRNWRWGETLDRSRASKFYDQRNDRSVEPEKEASVVCELANIT